MVKVIAVNYQTELKRENENQKGEKAIKPIKREGKSMKEIEQARKTEETE